jgi:hypothetical protein
MSSFGKWKKLGARIFAVKQHHDIHQMARRSDPLTALVGFLRDCWVMRCCSPHRVTVWFRRFCFVLSSLHNIYHAKVHQTWWMGWEQRRRFAVCFGMEKSPSDSAPHVSCDFADTMATSDPWTARHERTKIPYIYTVFLIAHMFISWFFFLDFSTECSFATNCRSSGT